MANFSLVYHAVAEIYITVGRDFLHFIGWVPKPANKKFINMYTRYTHTKVIFAAITWQHYLLHPAAALEQIVSRSIRAFTLFSKKE